MTIHRLKVWPQFFRALARDEKTFEARKDDRGFQVGDVLRLEEWDPETKQFTGAEVQRRVTYILRGPAFGVEAGHVIMAVK